jgi:hypothetical protein
MLRWWKRPNGANEEEPQQPSENADRPVPSYSPPSRWKVDAELFSAQFPVANKMFYVDLKQNANGTYLKISEKSGGRRHNVLIPEEGIDYLQRAIDEAVRVMKAQPPDPSKEE